MAEKEYIDKVAFNYAIREAVKKYPNSFYNGLEVARQIAHDFPAADVRPVVRGEWEEFEDFTFKPPVHAIRVKTCGNDWVTDCDATLTADKVRGFALDSEGVKVYSRERDTHGDYDNIYVPYSNLEALVFYFNEPPKEE